MKKHFLNLILAWLFCQPLNAWTQAVTAELGFTPATSGDQLSPYLSHWTSGAQDIYITLTNADIQSVDVQLTIEVFFDGNRVLEAKRKDFLVLAPKWATPVNRATESINVGNILQGNLPATYDGKYFEGVVDPVQVSVSGMLPVGNWEFCVQIDDFATGGYLDRDCEDGTVSGIQPPQLVYPLGETFLCNTAIRLEWMSHAPLFGAPANAVVKVWEVLQGQDADLVILNNLPILQRTLSGTTQTYVLPTELYAAPGGKHKYVWTVDPVTPGATIQDNQAAAEPDSFWIDCLPPNFLSMSSLAPPITSLIFPCRDTTLCDTSILFKWTAVPSPSKVSVKVWKSPQWQSGYGTLPSNNLILSREVSGVNQTYISSTDLGAVLGERNKYVWTVIPITGTGIQDTQAAAEPDSFWIDCTTPNPPVDQDDSPIGPVFTVGGGLPVPIITWLTTNVLNYIYLHAGCYSFDLGPDREYECGAPPIRLGDTTCRLNEIVWYSDPYGFHASESEVTVSPKVTTRYVAIMTTPAGTDVTEEVWVKVTDDFDVKLDTGNVCGKIHALIINEHECCNPTPRDSALKINTVTYDSSGNVIANGGSCLPCTEKVPSALTPAPDTCCGCKPYTYRWNNGATTASIQANTPGTYSCTVSNGTKTKVASIQFVPRCRGSFPPLQVTKYVRLSGPPMPFEITNAQGPAITNAYRYRLTITYPEGCQEVLEGYSKAGFANGQIRWTGRKFPCAASPNIHYTVSGSGSQTWVTSPFVPGTSTTTGGTPTVTTVTSGTSTVSAVAGGTSTFSSTTGGTTPSSTGISFPLNGQGLTGAGTSVVVGNTTYALQSSGWSTYLWELVLYNCDYPGTGTPGPYSIQYVHSKQNPINIGNPLQVRSGTFFVK